MLCRSRPVILPAKTQWPDLLYKYKGGAHWTIIPGWTNNARQTLFSVGLSPRGGAMYIALNLVKAVCNLHITLLLIAPCDSVDTKARKENNESGVWCLTLRLVFSAAGAQCKRNCLSCCKPCWASKNVWLNKVQCMLLALSWKSHHAFHSWKSEVEEVGFAVWTFWSVEAASALWPSGMVVKCCMPGAVGGDWLLRWTCRTLCWCWANNASWVSMAAFQPGCAILLRFSISDWCHVRSRMWSTCCSGVMRCATAWGNVDWSCAGWFCSTSWARN